MDHDYSGTVRKAKNYFKNLIREREKCIKQTDIDLPKRIEIQTLPNSNSKIVAKSEKHKKTVLIGTKTSPITKVRFNKVKNTSEFPVKHAPILKAELSLNIKKNKDTEIKNSITENSLESQHESVSLSSPYSTSIQISESSSTTRINQQCQEAIEKAKNYFQGRIILHDIHHGKNKNTPICQVDKLESKLNVSTSINSDNKHVKKMQQVKEYLENYQLDNVSATKKKSKPKYKPNQEQIICMEALTPAKKYLRSKMGLDQSVKKDKKSSSRTKTYVLPKETKIETHPNTTRDSIKADILNNPQLQSTLGQEIPQLDLKKSEHLTPAKKYLRAKLGIDAKNASKKPPYYSQYLEKSIERESLTQSDQNIEKNKKISPVTPLKPAPTPQPSKKKETYIKPRINFTQKQRTDGQQSSVNQDKNAEKNKKDISQKTATPRNALSTKTDVVTNIEPSTAKTNTLSFEINQPVRLTKSVERILSEAIKVGLKKVNRSEFKDLKIKINCGRNNVLEVKSPAASNTSSVDVTSRLDQTISNFQSEMDKRQKITYDKIQELENTLQFRKQQLKEMSSTKNKAVKHYNKNLKKHKLDYYTK